MMCLCGHGRQYHKREAPHECAYNRCQCRGFVDEAAREEAPKPAVFDMDQLERALERAFWEKCYAAAIASGRDTPAFDEAEVALRQWRKRWRKEANSV